MSVKTILVCLTTPTAAETLMVCATALARRHGAHLIGLHTMQAIMVYPDIAMHLPGPGFATFNEGQKKQAEDIKAIFDRFTAAEDFVAEWRLEKAESANAADNILDSARSADLVILSQANPKTDRPDHVDIQHDIIRDAGRPVLVVPCATKVETLGETILMGWSSTRESARAAHDAISLAVPGASTYLLTVATGSRLDRSTEASASDMAACLDRHGLQATLIERKLNDDTVAAILMREAFERGADMIVAGAFGHSRLYDFVIGAVTDELLEKMKVPVLFSK